MKKKRYNSEKGEAMETGRKENFMTQQGINHFTIKARIVALFFLLVIIPFILLFFIVFRSFHSYAVDSFSATAKNTTEIVGDQISNSIMKYEENSMEFYYGGYVDRLEGRRAVLESDRKDIQAFLEGSCRAYGDIKAAYLVYGDLVIQGGSNYYELLKIMKPHMEEIAKAGGKCLWYSVHSLRGKANTFNYVLARSINSFSEKNIGTLFFVIDDSFISDRLEQIRIPGATTCFVATDGTVLYSTDKALVHRQLDPSLLERTIIDSTKTFTMNDREYVGTIHNLVDPVWFVVTMIPVARMLDKILPVLKRFLWIAVIYTVFLVLMLFVLKKYVFEPLGKLKGEMDQYARGTLQRKSMAPVGVGELASLSQHFNDMTCRIDFLIRANKKELEEKNRQKINVLVAQLTPHFVYNSLNTIRWMAVLNKQPNIQKMTESLIYVFWNAAKTDDGNYTFGDEIKLIENYAFIQKARFMNFSIRYEVDDVTRSCVIGKLMIQPLVENAIVHGLGRGKVMDGIIVIRSHIEGEKLFIEVEDNGVGFDVGEWEKFPEKKEEHSSIGLRNIQQIIQLKYGKAGHLEIKSEPQKGTHIRFLVPVRFARENAK